MKYKDIPYGSYFIKYFTIMKKQPYRGTILVVGSCDSVGNYFPLTEFEGFPEPEPDEEFEIVELKVCQ